MERIRKAVSVSLVFTLYIMCFYYAFAVFSALYAGTSVLQALVDSLIVGFFLFVAIAFGVNMLYKSVEEREQIERQERQRQERDRPQTDEQDAPKSDDRRDI